VTIPSDVAEIPGVVDAVVEQCAAHRFSRQACTLNVRVALLEALANAVVKGNGEAPDKRVRVHAEVDDARLVVDVQDEGEPFDLDASASDPLTDDGLLREDGRGIFLMRRLMDGVERRPAVPRGNVVRLTLRRA
jgi:serine/threonine-protein kinase RsbW